MLWENVNEIRSKIRNSKCMKMHLKRSRQNVVCETTSVLSSEDELISDNCKLLHISHHLSHAYNVQLIYLQDIPDDEVQRHLLSSELESPRIIAFVTDEECRGIFITGDTVTTELNPRAGLLPAVHKLLGTYYVFDLTYPRPYSMVLGVLQVCVMEEPFKEETSKGFKLFVKQVRPLLTKHRSD